MHLFSGSYLKTRSTKDIINQKKEDMRSIGDPTDRRSKGNLQDDTEGRSQERAKQEIYRTISEDCRSGD